MPGRRLEAHLQSPLPLKDILAALHHATKALQGRPVDATGPGTDTYYEAILGMPGVDDVAGGPRVFWAIWWHDGQATQMDLLVEHRTQDPATPERQEAMRSGLVTAYETCRAHLKGATKGLRIKSADASPLRPRHHARTAPAPAPAEAMPRFARTNRFSGKEAGYQAPCPHCGGFAHYKEPGRVSCRFCSQWFTLHG